MNYLISLITTKNKKEAINIGKVLVKEKLAACVNIISPINSIYRWRGKIEKTNEVLLIVKTKKGLEEEIIKKVKALHGYENPEIIFLKIEKGSKEYLKWIGENVK